MQNQFRIQHYCALGLVILAMLAASIQPLEFESYLLHQAGTVFMMAGLLIAFKKVGLSFSSFVLYLIFLLIHIVGAHYLYSYVPYNDWILHSFGFNLDQSMGWSRNMYDRFVHLTYGILLYPVLLRLFEIWFPKNKPIVLYLLVIQFVMASSLIYEWVEWLIALGLSPEDAENYNGQQGDIWDAHMDMLLATIGAILMGCFYLIKKPTP
ncbi:DUF2238 domain-containing protein [Acinetobacter sp. YT-02]|uniref:DUF2238 domain-containing protein n=1 Tax=Acinetobacter sp. YT-02 TaxID=2018564 RepID=UPI000BC4EC37|nr:DUF2238 domain-containing protein [Acinetobacter sp. YT-02]PCN61431.1 hypothetical protein CF596_02240 [Acinetobacter sp. YT-02]